MENEIHRDKTSLDPDPESDPDPYQNEKGPQHWSCEYTYMYYVRLSEIF